MYILQNALQNVLRNRGRNILIGVIVFAIITTSVVALIINNTASGIIDDYKNRFGSEVSIRQDMQTMQAFRQGPGGGVQTNGGSIADPISPQQYLSFSESEYLLYTTMSASQMVGTDDNCTNLTAYGAESDGMGGQMRIAGADNEDFIMPQFRLLGGQFDEFDEGTREVTDGRLPEADNECIISEEFAATNNLSVDDAITVGGSPMRGMIEGGAVVNTYYTLTITGIYFDATEEDSTGMFISSIMNRRNEILVTFDTLANPLRDSETGANIEATYYLKDPAMLADFETEVRAKGLSDEYVVSTDQTGYDTTVKPVVGLKGITLTFLIIVLILGAIILLLLSSIAIRERKYEIGVLRAMGMKKHKVALGLWSEMLIITCVCVVLGLAVGTLAAQPVSDILLDAQIESINNAAQNGPMGGRTMMVIGGRAMTSVTALDTLDVSLGITTLLQIIGISLALATAAALAAVTKITKYEPIKILMERN